MADVEIREISPDVAAAVILLKVDPFTPPDGITRPSSEDRLSLILTKRSGRWLIAHGTQHRHRSRRTAIRSGEDGLARAAPKSA